jgi:hypothetical protein
MIKHINRKSISDCLLKIIVTYSTEVHDDSKKEVISKIISVFNTSDNESRDNICEILCEMLQNRRIYYLIAKNKIILEQELTKLIYLK